MMESSSQITSSSGQGPEHTQLLPLLHSVCARTGQTSMQSPLKIHGMWAIKLFTSGAAANPQVLSKC